MKYIKYIYLTIITISLSSCLNDLDTIPLDEDIITSENVYDNPDTYKQVLAKLYAGLAVSGQSGPAGQSDIGGIDEGFGQYLRAYWYHQELPTDEAVIGWNDQTIADFHDLDWTASDQFIAAFYSRIFYQISLCNEFIRQTEDDKLDSREVDSALRMEIAAFRDEARFLRALSYWHAIDHFRNVPFVTEENEVGADLPMQGNAQTIFDYIESELLAIESTIAPAKQNEYGRADQGAVQTLLAKLYLNAEVYVGQNRYADCKSYCEKVLSSGYTLEEEYNHLFMADNHTSDEIIFPIAFDGINTRTWGGMTFIIRAGIGGDIDPAASGVVSGWGGTRTTKEIVNLFGEIGGLIRDFEPKINLPQSYIVGPHTGDTINTNYAITSLNNDRVFQGFQYFPEANNSFIIPPNPTLSFFYGDNGADGTMEIAGAPIVAEEAGLYYIRADFNDNTYELKRVNLAATGTAVQGSPVFFEYDTETRTLSAEFSVSPGGLTIEDTEGFVALGDSDGDGYLSVGDGPLEIDYSEPIKLVIDIQKEAFNYQIGSTSFDRRGIFSNEGQTLEINSIGEYTEGYAVTKFKNITSDGMTGSDTDFPDTDFPMFRLADVHLMAAEAILRDNGSAAEALDHFNTVRRRAYKGSGGDFTADNFQLSDIIQERARELYWECHRRTDLVRFDLLTTSDYLWSWKGGTIDGQAVEPFRNVYPLPTSDLNANPNLEQNEGY